jgi:hypothetical protein
MRWVTITNQYINTKDVSRKNITLFLLPLINKHEVGYNYKPIYQHKRCLQEKHYLVPSTTTVGDGLATWVCGATTFGGGCFCNS